MYPSCLPLRAASGQTDTGEIRHARQKLMSEMALLLDEHSGELTGEIAGALKQYFDNTRWEPFAERRRFGGSHFPNFSGQPP